MTIGMAAMCLSCGGPAHAPLSPLAAESLLIQAKAEAKKQGKHVLVLFTAPDSEWSECLERFHAESEVARIIGKRFVVLKIDLINTPGGEQMYLENGSIRGAPAFTLLDHHGMTLANSGDGEENIGFPADETQIAQYLACLRTACPDLSEDEASVLRQKLLHIQPREPAGPAKSP